MISKIDFLMENDDYINSLEWGICSPYPTWDRWRSIIKRDLRDINLDGKFTLNEIDWIIEELDNRGVVAHK